MDITPHIPKVHRGTSWRDLLPVHPAAELFPLMSPDELKALGEDIKANGLTSPIVVTMASPTDKASVQLVDGRNRLDAMELVEITVMVRALRDPELHREIAEQLRQEFYDIEQETLAETRAEEPRE